MGNYNQLLSSGQNIERYECDLPLIKQFKSTNYEFYTKSVNRIPQLIAAGRRCGGAITVSCLQVIGCGR